MTKVDWTICLLAAMAFWNGSVCSAQTKNAPDYISLGKPPEDDKKDRNVVALPRVNLTKASVERSDGSVVCVAGDCKQIDSAPFGTDTHKKIVEKGQICSDPLIEAVYWQDYFHQFESKAHFDNCAFDDGLRYVEELLQGVDHHVQQNSRIDKNKVMFTLGQALHAIQDFYAHSDYIEQMQKKFGSFRDVPVLPIWKPEARAGLQDLARQGLVSGVVWWNGPKRCTAGALTHAQLNKDSDDNGSGRGPDKTIWPNWSNFEAARRLAQEASEQFLQYAFSRWPVLEKECGNAMIYVVSPESRIEPSAE